MDVHLVRAYQTNPVGLDPPKQLWIAAVPREDAVQAVQRVLPKGWRAELAYVRLPPESVARLVLRPGEVREITTTIPG